MDKLPSAKQRKLYKDSLEHKWLKELNEDQRIEMGILISQDRTFEQAYQIIKSKAKENNIEKKNQQIEDEKEQEEEKWSNHIKTLHIETQQRFYTAKFLNTNKSNQEILNLVLQEQYKDEEKARQKILHSYQTPNKRSVLYRFTLACYNFLRHAPWIPFNAFTAILNWLQRRISGKNS